MKTKNRLKSDNTNLMQIAGWTKADKVVNFIAEHQLEINKAQQKLQTQINKAKTEFAESVKKHQEKIKYFITSLEAFAISHKKDFKDQRSRKLNFGIIGWRFGTSIKVKKIKTTLELIKKQFSAATAANFIRTKEEVDKEALAKLSDKELAKIGVTREKKDQFYVEPDLPKLVDYEKR